MLLDLVGDFISQVQKREQFESLIHLVWLAIHVFEWKVDNWIRTVLAWCVVQFLIRFTAILTRLISLLANLVSVQIPFVGRT